jgi:hypothetical protein
MSGIDSYTKLMLHMDGTDASTTFTDESSNAKSVTAYGHAQIDTAQSKFGGASALFDGAGDDYLYANSHDFTFGTGAFSVDCWVRFTALPSANTGVWLAGQTIANGQTYWAFEVWNLSGNMKLIIQGANGGSNLTAIISDTITLATDTWYHVAICRSGNDHYFFLDGVQAGAPVSNSQAYPAVLAPFSSGLRPVSPTDSRLNGWIDELRVSRGIARWTANFTPPVAAYSTDAYTLL